MKKIFSLVFAIFILSGCVSTQDQAISTKVSARAYNDVAKQYLPMLTSAYIITDNGNNGAEYIKYLVDLYGYNQFGKERFFFVLDKAGADTTIQIIDKYLSWEEIASRDSDMINKEIKLVKGPELYPVAYKFGMTSGNEKNHYLYINQCSSGGLMEVCLYNIYFNKNDALILKNELNKFISGSLKTADDTKYQ